MQDTTIKDEAIGYEFNPIIVGKTDSSAFKFSSVEALRLAGRLALKLESYLSSKTSDSANHLKDLKLSLRDYNEYILEEVRTRG